MYKEVIAQGSLGEIINMGNIWFIPKVGDPKSITSWRPITLLNVSYKILAKSIAKRVKYFLLLNVRPEQTGFFKGRYIMDNIIGIWEGMERAHQSNQDILFMKIDFEKAYDKVEWDFSSWCLRP